MVESIASAEKLAQPANGKEGLADQMNSTMAGVSPIRSPKQVQTLTGFAVQAKSNVCQKVGKSERDGSVCSPFRPMRRYSTLRLVYELGWQ